MAGRIAGITIEIDGNTTKLEKSLKGVDSQLKQTQSALRDVDKLLKLDPKNTELLTQKQKNLEKAIAGTKTRLNELKNAQSGVAHGSDEWDRLQREIIATEQDLKNLKKQYDDFGSVAAQKISAVGKSMESFGNKVQSVGEKLQPLSTAATGALAGLGALAYKSVTTADELNTLAKQTGFTTDEIQKMQYASDLVDVSFESMTGALKKLKPQITDDNKALKELGVETKNADGTTRDATAVFYDVIKALSKIPNETERDQKAMKIFGKSADELAGIIDDGGAALRKYGQEAQDFGLIMEQDTVDALNQVKDTIDQLKARGGSALAQFGATLVQTLAPVLEKVIGFLEKVTTVIANLTPAQAEFIVKVLAVTAAIGPLLTVGGKLISGIGTVLTLIPKIVSGISLLMATISPTVLLIAVVVAAVVAATVLIIKNWDSIKEAAGKLKDAVVKKWNAMKDGIKAQLDKIKTAISNVTSNIKQAWTNGTNAIANTASNVWNKVVGIYQAGATAVGNVMQGIHRTTQNIWGAVTGAFWAGVSNMQSALSNMWKSVINVFSNIIGFVSNVVGKLKSLFNFKWELPKIKLPHFVVKWTEIGKWLSIPHISIEWYKKAYDNPYVFTSPTVMQTPYGAKGFGDGNGSEVVMGMKKLKELVGASGDTNVTINVYGAQGQNINQLADEIQRRFISIQRQKEAAGVA